MSAIGIIDHPHLRHVTMAVCLCVAVLAFVALIVATIVVGRACLRQTTTYAIVMNRLKTVLALAAVTGLLASVPFAWAMCSRTAISFLLWDLAYAGLIALGALFFAVLVARIATGQIPAGDCEMPCEARISGHRPLFRINPSSGLPMNGALDFAGNFYGWDSHSRPHHIRDL